MLREMRPEHDLNGWNPEPGRAEREDTHRRALAEALVAVHWPGVAGDERTRAVGQVAGTLATETGWNRLRALGDMSWSGQKAVVEAIATGTATGTATGAAPPPTEEERVHDRRERRRETRREITGLVEGSSDSAVDGGRVIAEVLTDPELSRGQRRHGAREAAEHWAARGRDGIADMERAASLVAGDPEAARMLARQLGRAVARAEPGDRFTNAAIETLADRSAKNPGLLERVVDFAVDVATGERTVTPDGEIVIESPELLRVFVPSQIAWDEARSACANGGLSEAGVHAAVAATEIAATIAIAGLGRAAVGAGQGATVALDDAARALIQERTLSRAQFDAAVAEVAERIPAGWTSTSTMKGVGVRFDRGKDSGVRIDLGDPDLRWSTQRVDHVVIRDNGRYIGADGTEFPSGTTRNTPEIHIPLSEYRTWRTWNAP